MVSPRPSASPFLAPALVWFALFSVAGAAALFLVSPREAEGISAFLATALASMSLVIIELRGVPGRFAKAAPALAAALVAGSFLIALAATSGNDLHPWIAPVQMALVAALVGLAVWSSRRARQASTGDNA